jgi:hypothetical protein
MLSWCVSITQKTNTIFFHPSYAQILTLSIKLSSCRRLEAGVHVLSDISVPGEGHRVWRDPPSTIIFDRVLHHFTVSQDSSEHHPGLSNGDVYIHQVNVF